MKTLVATLFISLLVLAGSPTSSVANTTPTLAPTMNCDPCGSTVNGHDFNLHSVYLYPGHVHINLSGDGDSDLDLFVLDSNGRVVARSVSGSDDERIGLNVYSGGYFTIKVKNLGHAYNVYQLWIS